MAINRRQIALGAYVGWVALTTYWFVAMNGLVRVVNLAQLGWWGSYYNFVTILALHLPVIALLRVVAGSRRPLTAGATELFRGVPVFPLLIIMLGVGIGGW